MCFSNSIMLVRKSLMKIKCVCVCVCRQIISQLPEEWKPGETFYGCPWQVVVITALVGVITFTMFFWRTVFPVSFVSLSILQLLEMHAKFKCLVVPEAKIHHYLFDPQQVKKKAYLCKFEFFLISICVRLISI